MEMDEPFDLLGIDEVNAQFQDVDFGHHTHVQSNPIYISSSRQLSPRTTTTIPTRKSHHSFILPHTISRYFTHTHTSSLHPPQLPSILSNEFYKCSVKSISRTRTTTTRLCHPNTSIHLSITRIHSKYTVSIIYQTTNRYWRCSHPSLQIETLVQTPLHFCERLFSSLCGYGNGRTGEC